MKKLILSAVAVLGLTAATSTVNANTLSNLLVTTSAVQDSTTKTAVKLEDLPDSVKTTLQSDQIKEWTPSDASLVKDAQGTEYYLINVTKGTEKAFLRIGKDGKVIQ